MSNPYSQPSIAGYNASPPADDASEVASNQLEWAKHITKIGNPLKTYAQAIDAAALAAFGLTFGAAVLSKSANYIVTVNDRGRWIGVTGTSTITLPSAATVGDGFPLLVINLGSDVVTIDGDSSELINGALTLTLIEGDFALLNSNGTAWTAAWTNIARNTEKDSFVPTFTGFSADPGSPTVNWARSGNLVTLYFGFNTGTSDASGFTIDNVPAAIRPDVDQIIPIGGLIDNDTTEGWGNVIVTSAGTLDFCFQDSDPASWTTSGAKGFSFASGYRPSITYALDLI